MSKLVAHRPHPPLGHPGLGPGSNTPGPSDHSPDAAVYWIPAQGRDDGWGGGHANASQKKCILKMTAEDVDRSSLDCFPGESRGPCAPPHLPVARHAPLGSGSLPGTAVVKIAIAIPPLGHPGPEPGPSTLSLRERSAVAAVYWIPAQGRDDGWGGVCANVKHQKYISEIKLEILASPLPTLTSISGLTSAASITARSV